MWDVHCALAIEPWRARTARSSPRGWPPSGELEALGSLAGFAWEHPDDVYPELVEGEPRFEAEGLGHPLMPEARCVRNDVTLGGATRVLIVSGSNMSGKSTLLRAVGVNAVLALAGAPVRAARLRLSRLSVGATLRIRDSLQEGTSRFYAELVRLRDLVRIADGPVPLLFLLDEILHGTNSHDRRLGAAAVVSGLVERGAIGLVTTHDLALSEVADDPGVARRQRALRGPAGGRADGVRLPDAAGRRAHLERAGADAHAGAVARRPLALTPPGDQRQAIFMAAAFSRPSSLMLSSRMRNFCTLPVTVIGNASTNFT